MVLHLSILSSATSSTCLLSVVLGDPVYTVSYNKRTHFVCFQPLKYILGRGEVSQWLVTLLW